jgi:Trk K+ transport system NAD-binding subunit
VALLGFILLMLVGMLYMHASYNIGYAAGLYETLKLLTLQSGFELPRDPVGRALFFAVPLLGLALILDSVFRFGRLVLDKSSRREAWQVALASTYQRHVIVCGLGRVGLGVVTQLLETGSDVVVVEQNWNSEFVKRALDLKVPIVLGDARDVMILRQARIGRAHAVIVCINNDLINIEVALNVRQQYPAMRVIQRVFSQDLDHNLESTFGRNTVFSASALAAPTFAAAAISREVKHVLPIDEEALGITELVVASESLMSGFVRKIEESYGIRVLRHVDSRGKLLVNEKMRQLSSGDRVMLIGPLSALETLRVKNVPKSKVHSVYGALPLQRPTKEFNRVIVCGLGKVGYRVVKRLYQAHPRPHIVVIYHEGTQPEFVRQIQRLDGVTMVQGDARSDEVLTEAGIAEAYSVAALTSDDLVNLQIGLAARRRRQDVHLVLRVFSDPLADQLDKLFTIRTTYSTSALAAPTMAAAAVLGDVSHAFFAHAALYSSDTQVMAHNNALVGITVEQVRQQHHALVIGIRRAGRLVVLPELDEQIMPDDQVTLLATLEALSRLRHTIGQVFHAPLDVSASAS